MEDEINNINPENIKLNIVYEDNDLLILNKEEDIVVHPTKSHQSNTLSNGIAYYFKEKKHQEENSFCKSLRYGYNRNINSS